jgi:4-amino-4-deoxy-L-arabinose transferase-like glycosyltransferase
MGKTGNWNEDKPKERLSIVLLLFITSMTFLARIYRAGDPIGGFHCFNEAWYSIITFNYTNLRSLLYPTAFGRVDFYIPPLLSYFLYFSVKIFGRNEFALHLVPIIFSTLHVPLIYALARRYFGRKAGIYSALFYSFAPVSMIVGKNIQTDPVYLFFLLSCLLTYLRAREKGYNIALMAASGILFGIALHAKQFAMIIVPAVFLWETLRNKGIKWITRGHFVMVFSALIPLLPFYGFHLLRNPHKFFGDQVVEASFHEYVFNLNMFKYLLNEYFWGLSPALAVLAVAGIIYLLIRRGEGSLFILLAIIVFNIFFIFFHYHSYYQIFCLPYLCMAAGSMLANIKLKLAGAILCGGAVLISIVFSFAMLCSLKFGFNEFVTISDIMHKQKLKPILIAGAGLGGNYLPVMTFYMPDVEIRMEESLISTNLAEMKFGPDRPLFFLGVDQNDQKRFPPLQFIIKRNAFGMYLFGYRLDLKMWGENFFNVTSLSFKRERDVFDFGIYETNPVTSLVVGYAPPGSLVKIVKGRIDFRKNGDKEKVKVKVKVNNF